MLDQNVYYRRARLAYVGAVAGVIGIIIIAVGFARGGGGASAYATTGRIARFIDASRVADSTVLTDNGAGTLGVVTTTPAPTFAMDINAPASYGLHLQTNTHGAGEQPTILFTNDASQVRSMFSSEGQYFTNGFMGITGGFQGTWNPVTGAYSITSLGIPTAEPGMLALWSDVGGPTVMSKGSTAVGSYAYEGIDKFGNVTLKIENDGAIKWGAGLLSAVDVGIERVIAGVAMIDNGTEGVAGILRVADPVNSLDAVNLEYLNAHVGGGSTISPAAISGLVANWNPAGFASASVVRILTAGSAQLTGMVAGSSGQVVTLVNLGPDVVTVFGENSSSAAGNRIDFPTAAGTAQSLCAAGTDDHYCTITFRYDGGEGRWMKTAEGVAALAGDSLNLFSYLAPGRVISAINPPSATCNGGTAHPTPTGGEWMAHVAPAIDTTTCALTFAHTLVSCTCSMKVDHIELATGIGRTCSFAGAVLTVTAAPSWALGDFDVNCSVAN